MFWFVFFYLAVRRSRTGALCTRSWGEAAQRHLSTIACKMAAFIKNTLHWQKQTLRDTLHKYKVKQVRIRCIAWASIRLKFLHVSKDNKANPYTSGRGTAWFALNSGCIVLLNSFFVVSFLWKYVPFLSRSNYSLVSSLIKIILSLYYHERCDLCEVMS